MTKLFLGGISPNTSTEVIREYFSQFGQVVDAVAMITADGKHRGFGFVTFDSEEGAELAMASEQVIDGRTVDIKRADGAPPGPGMHSYPARGGQPRPSSAYGASPAGCYPGGYGYGWGPPAYGWGPPPPVGMMPYGGYGACGRSSAPSRPPPMSSGKGKGGGGADATNKVFIGGLTKDTSDDVLREYFSQFGSLTDCVVIKDKETNRSRGFGFVAYEDPESVDVVMEGYESHQIDGKWIEVKRATARDAAPGPAGGGMGGMMPPSMHMAMPSRPIGAPKGGYNGMGPSMHALPSGGHEKGGGINGGANKVFVGGLSSETGDEDLREYFERYGNLIDCVVMKDKVTMRPRGFGFVQYDNPDSVENVMQDYSNHNIAGKWVEVKRAASRPEGGPPTIGMHRAPSGPYGPVPTTRTFRPGPYGY